MVQKHKAAEYREMADRVLAEAEKITDPEIKLNLLDIASRYNWMAEWVERQEEGPG